MTTLSDLLFALLSIESPTFHEKECIDFCENWIHENTQLNTRRIGDNLIATSKQQNLELPHLCFVGHLDVVPPFFTPYEENGRCYGSGASDMKGGVAAILSFLAQNEMALIDRYRLSIILYAREEGTAMTDNGLFEVIQSDRPFVSSIDLAIIAEPTNNTIQLGCMGSIHAQIKVNGKSAHSARPWEGVNALYAAIPVLSYFAEIPPVDHDVFGVTFKDVISITESASQSGRTSVPGSWNANVNFRYAPVHQNPESLLRDHCRNAGVDDNNVTITDHAIAGDVIESPFFNSVIKRLSLPIAAKQAWTDVAQLTQLGIPAFNFGPGLTAQAHQDNEYILLHDINTYISRLTRLMMTPKAS